jgi:acetyltransferase-like isoleucine patch superfamily enzyme
MSKLAMLVSFIAAPLPWSLRRLLLQSLCGFKIHRTAFISRFALMVPFHLEVGPRGYIGPFTVCKGLSLLRLEESGFIGPFNWITAFPLGTKSKHFELNPERKPQLTIERHAAITNRHIIDCTDEVFIGAFSTFAGFRSQILTHSIELKESRQRCNPVRIGAHCFVGTCCVLLGGSVLPDRCVLGAHSMLGSRLETPGYVYGGVPAKPIKPIDPDDKYFLRDTGYVL